MDDVFKIGKQLKYSLMLKRIPLSSINLYLSRNKEQ